MAARVAALVPGVGGVARRAGAGAPPDPVVLAAELVATLERALLVARQMLATLDVAIEDDAAPVGCPGLGSVTRRLSRREAEVLRLLAAGHSNRRIAHTLCLSPRTVQRHVANVYLKIGAHCRVEATTYAFVQGLC
jgi:DNA-binding NarL/FixJ family response regulator